MTGISHLKRPWHYGGKTASKTLPNTGKAVVKFPWPWRRTANEAIAMHAIICNKVAPLVF